MAVFIPGVYPGITGDAIAFTTVNTGGFRLYIRRMDQLEPRVATDQNIAARNLSFSPDGRWIAFTEGAVVKKLALDGGAPVLVALIRF